MQELRTSGLRGEDLHRFVRKIESHPLHEDAMRLGLAAILDKNLLDLELYREAMELADAQRRRHAE